MSLWQKWKQQQKIINQLKIFLLYPTVKKFIKVRTQMKKNKKYIILKEIKLKQKINEYTNNK